MPVGTAAIEAVELCAGYDRQPVVKDLNLSVAPGEIVALLGPNGAGKTTTLLTLAGELPSIGGQTRLFGERASGPLHRRARRGLALITEERSVFMGMSVRDNLRIGGGSVEGALEIFPELTDHLGRKAGLLSGGQQQMLTLGRALSRRPRVLLADELSLGLAPVIVDRLLDQVSGAAKDGLAVLLVEQHVSAVLGVADRGYVLVHGRVQLEGTSAELSADGRLEQAYLASAS
ncbi:ABC transporter ATP-binding protein [Parafrankia elaeagni]|uniref:ABC transporter ATP-binding protein n=1 Tax=Parafrankia elaeagni TaxID=222534 RepID=UPI0003825EC7